MTTWEINFIRYGFAGFILLLVSLFLRARDVFCTSPDQGYVSVKGSFEAKHNLHKRSPTKRYGNLGIVESFPSWYRLPNLSWHSWSVVFVGVIFVSFLCPALQGYALFRLAFSLAITLNSVTPLYAIPLMWLFKNQKPSKRGCIGALIAVTGVMVLCIWGYN
jgi:drug/metabolite transporter (DMT)-like permease